MNINTKVIGFRALRNCGKSIMHLIVVSMCTGLTLCCIYGAHILSIRNFYSWTKFILYPIYYYLVINYVGAYI